MNLLDILGGVAGGDIAYRQQQQAAEMERAKLMLEAMRYGAQPVEPAPVAPIQGNIAKPITPPNLQLGGAGRITPRPSGLSPIASRNGLTGVQGTNLGPTPFQTQSPLGGQLTTSTTMPPPSLTMPALPEGTIQIPGLGPMRQTVKALTEGEYLSKANTGVYSPVPTGKKGEVEVIAPNGQHVYYTANPKTYAPSKTGPEINKLSVNGSGLYESVMARSDLSHDQKVAFVVARKEVPLNERNVIIRALPKDKAKAISDQTQKMLDAAKKKLEAQ